MSNQFTYNRLFLALVLFLSLLFSHCQYTGSVSFDPMFKGMPSNMDFPFENDMHYNRDSIKSNCDALVIYGNETLQILRRKEDSLQQEFVTKNITILEKGIDSLLYDSKTVLSISEDSLADIKNRHQNIRRRIEYVNKYMPNRCKRKGSSCISISKKSGEWDGDCNCIEKAVPDKTVSTKAVPNKNISMKAVPNKTVSKKTVLNKTVINENDNLTLDCPKYGVECEMAIGRVVGIEDGNCNCILDPNPKDDKKLVEKKGPAGPENELSKEQQIALESDLLSGKESALEYFENEDAIVYGGFVPNIQYDKMKIRKYLTLNKGREDQLKKVEIIGIKWNVNEGKINSVTVSEVSKN